MKYNGTKMDLLHDNNHATGNVDTDDLSKLNFLDEIVILEHLRNRFYQEKYYIFFGEVLVAVNPYRHLSIYGDEFHQRYDTRTVCQIPHIFWTAQQSYCNILETARDQCILVSGESGAGKTETTKHLVSHIVFMAASRRSRKSRNGQTQDNLHDKIIGVNPLLEAFGNASTLMNENSSRFGKFLELFFSAEGCLEGAKVRTYMLEKSRVVVRGRREQNFHIFNYLLAGISREQQQDFCLDDPGVYRIMHSEDDMPKWETSQWKEFKNTFDETLKILNNVGFTETDVSLILTVLSAILNLTNIVFQNDPDTDGVEILDEYPLQIVANLMSLDIEVLTTALISNSTFIRGEEVVTLKKKVQADDGRDALAKALYAKLFDWVVGKTNMHLKGNGSQRGPIIGILDMSGFERFPINGFEQLCINAANERFHQFFNKTIFQLELEDYRKEGVDATKVKFRDNQPVIDLLFQKPRGVLCTIDEECMFPKATDRSLCDKLHQQCGNSPHYKANIRHPESFIVHHYAGEVKYDCAGVLVRNRDKLGSNLQACVLASTSQDIAGLFLHDSGYNKRSSSNRRSSGRFKRPPFQESLSKSTARRLYSNGSRGNEFQQDLKLSSFASVQFQQSLSTLVEKLSDCKPWFVKCIKPNPIRSSDMMEEELVMEQLECNGLVELAQVRRDGYAVRIYPQEFVNRFRDISFPLNDVVTASMDNVIQILKDAGLDDYTIGDNKVFLRHWQEPFLRDLVLAVNRELPASPTPSPISSSDKNQASSGLDTDQDNQDDINDQGRATSGSDYFVSAWMQQQGNHTPEVDIPPYESVKATPLEEQIKTIHERKILDPRWWDRFQMMPIEQVSSGTTFQAVFKFFKVICYIFLFISVLCSAVVNKICILMMTSTVTKDPLPEAQWPVKTMMIVSMCFPYSVWFMVYSGKSVFGSSTWPSLSLLSMVLFFELLHTLGLCLLVFRVLPMVDMVRGFILLGSIYIVPAFLKTLFEGRDPSTGLTRKCGIFILNAGALLIQIGSIVACGIFNVPMSSEEKEALRDHVIIDDVAIIVERPPPAEMFSGGIMWELPVALLLISCAYWENYVEGEFTIFRYTIKFNDLKKYLHHARARLYIFASIWKVLWIIAFAVLLQSGFSFNMDYSGPATAGQTNNSSKHMNITDTVTELESRVRRDTSGVNNMTKSNVTTTHHDPFYIHPETMRHFEEYGILYIQMFASTWLAYFGGIACKMCMQLLGFSLPLILVTPISIAIVVMQCTYGFLPTGKLVWIGIEADRDVWFVYLAWVGVLWLSEVFITSHVWFPTNMRMEKIERLFVTPLKCGILTDQSLLLRRRRNDHDISLNADDDTSPFPEPDVYKADDIVPQIYACATMWHETRAEMSNLLKSIFRVDIDHSGRYLAQKFYKIRDPDYYEFEAHIFFDDAMELSDDDKLVPNMFVADMMDCIDDSLSSVHERQMSLGPPSRTPTPYGGRLTWKLPGGSKMIVHMKDKHKIRHKKRWSQVMYMYYLLSYRILAQPENMLKKNMFDKDEELQRHTLTAQQLRRRRKSAHFTRSVIFNYVTDEVHSQAENTYILTLDGDVDFHPDAVRLLVDRLKTNKKVGAACGRIHPIGSGPLLWYQQFEYAIGHWLQKATEHVFGCVMCAPGCFSLFRGSALMDDNVARTYATRATEAGHYVQYDQGEDRWLSTLLLQQGYRIDYCAASDALTHAPETFSEFFNQRRRWGSSTLANIIDLLGSWKGTIRINDNISTLYILYQFCMMASTILGPATILLMMAGAFTVVFKVGVTASYAMALGPAIAFILICIYCKPSTQMMVASVMSAVYAIIMTIVLVGTIGQAIEGGLTSPNVIFLLMLVIIFFVSAVMHPEEFFCVIPGALYFICLPTGYLLLTIYYLCNMHIVSWGTREIPKRKTKEQILEEKRIEKEIQQKKEEKKKSILGWIGLNTFFKEIGELLKQLRTDATRSDKSKTDMLLMELIKEIRTNREPNLGAGSNSSSIMGGFKPPVSDANIPSIPVSSTTTVSDETEQHLTSITATEPVEVTPVWLNMEDPENPAWLRSPTCGNGPIKRMSEKEHVFWKQVISKYLLPLVEDKSHKEKIAKDLKNLRSNVVFGFFMTSALWVALSMELQILQEELRGSLFFKIPRWDDGEDLTFEPLGLIFLAFFAMILCIQFVGMFAHRWGTVLHMLSITDISCGRTFTEKDKIREIITKAMKLQKLCNIENEPIPDYDEPIADYGDDSDQEADDIDPDHDILDTVSVTTNESVSLSVMSANPPSYHSALPMSPQRRKQARKDIFNKKGAASGRALRRAFEKRFRNENQGFSSYDIDNSETSDRIGLFDLHEERNSTT